MRITILTYGTRGDVYPYLALALALKEAGHEVKLAADTDFAADVQSRGIEYAPISVSMRSYLQSDLGQDNIFGENKKTQTKNKKELKKQLTEHYWPIILSDLWTAAQDSELIIYTAMLYHAWYIAEKLDIPAIISFPSPVITPTGEFPIPEIPVNLGGVLNRVGFHLLKYLFFSRDHEAITRWCHDTLKVRPGHRLTNYFYRKGRPVPTLYCYSPCLLPKPRDWGNHIAVSGYWFLDTGINWQPPDELKKFLATGPPPVYIGFGSTVKGSAEATTRMVTKALELAGERGIISTGLGSMMNKDLPDTVCCVDYVPYEWLFPQVKAVVHHGGAGITGTALQFGKPATACPFLPEQMFWGRLIHKLGVGSAPVPQKPQHKFTSERLAEAITNLNDTELVQNAEQLSHCLQAEDGLQRAVEFIHAQVDIWNRSSR
jgi:sterol 3beta-glucosyltransferase